MTQARLVRKLEARACEVGQTLETVKSQEKVITKLEGLLKQAAQERRVAVATAEKLQQQLVNLESQQDTSAAQVSITALLAIHFPLDLEFHFCFLFRLLLRSDLQLECGSQLCTCLSSCQDHASRLFQPSRNCHDFIWRVPSMCLLHPWPKTSFGVCSMSAVAVCCTVQLGRQALKRGLARPLS